MIELPTVDGEAPAGTLKCLNSSLGNSHGLMPSRSIFGILSRHVVPNRQGSIRGQF